MSKLERSVAPAGPGRALTGGEPWQIALFRKSIKKKQTLDAILALLPSLQKEECLEIGCATGLTSYFLRQRGGRWLSVDFEADHVSSARALVGGEVVQMGEESIDLPDACRDLVVGINFLEHLVHDREYLREMVRVLRPGGIFVLTGPKGERGRPAYWLKRLYGFNCDSGGFGHARDGYPPERLRALLEEAGLQDIEIRSYSRFFTEAVEDTLNYGYNLLSRRHSGKTAIAPAVPSAGKEDDPSARPEHRGDHDFHGNTAPMSQDAFAQVGKAFRLYSALYPFLRMVAALDALVPGRDAGYMFACRAVKR